MDQPDLSIIIPAYNELDRLPPTLDRIVAYLAAQGRTDYEIVVVDDGSTDGTLDFARRYAAGHPRIKAVTNGVNRGKGFSVQHGLLEARGRLLIFSDSDLSTPIEEMPKLLTKLAQGYDMVIASRYSPDARLQERQPFYRRFVRIGFNLLVRAITGLGFHDTQCGFKAFTRRSAEIIAPRLTIPGFGFDPEMLWIARRFNLRTTEVGVVWINDPRSKVRVVRDSWRMFLDLIGIRIRELKGKYR